MNKIKVLAIAAFIVIAFPVVSLSFAVATVPECKTEIFFDKNGNQCLLCVIGGSMSDCTCGGAICQEEPPE